VFEAAEATSGDLTDPEYLAAAQTNRAFGRNAIDSLLAQGFDAVITPSFSFGTSPAATGGYPSMAVPVGFTSVGGPVGFWMSASFLQEPTLIALGSAIGPDASAPASRSLPKSIEAGCACAHPAR
jgi:amidase